MENVKENMPGVNIAELLIYSYQLDFVNTWTGTEK